MEKGERLVGVKDAENATLHIIIAKNKNGEVRIFHIKIDILLRLLKS